MTDNAVCERCGRKLVPIAYGYPSVEMREARDRGELVLGGCLVGPSAATAECTTCRRPYGAGR